MIPFKPLCHVPRSRSISITLLRPLFLAFALLFLCQCKQNNAHGSQIDLDPAAIDKGQVIFEKQCSTCHFMGQPSIGPDLSGLTTTVETQWIKEFIRRPSQKIMEKDERALALFDQYQVYMPNFPSLTDSELDHILSYLHNVKKTTEDKKETRTALTNPIKDTVADSGIVATIELFAQAPATSENAPLARINKLDCESGSGRLFINDLRGMLYEIEQGQVKPYLSMAEHKNKFIHEPGLATGLGSFVFHPNFRENGLLYTAHTEPPSTKKADFAYEDSIKVTLQWVVTEWQSSAPASKSFTGTSRELLRIDFVGGIHGMQELAFNPTVGADNPDYGKLYIGLGDGGSTINGVPHISDHEGSGIWSSIIRIDPSGTNSVNGNYGIPKDNPFVEDAKKVKELWAYGFRNPNRIIWDAQGRLIATDIGETQIEEVNMVAPGNHYGWPHREGSFIIDPYGDLSNIFPLEADDASYGYTYPILQIDHDDGNAISGGHIGKNGPFKNKYVFGDIPTGTLYMADLTKGEGSRTEHWNIAFKGKQTNLYQLSGNSRVDLRLGKDCNEAIYLFTKSDGRIYKVNEAH